MNRHPIFTIIGIFCVLTLCLLLNISLIFGASNTYVDHSITIDASGQSIIEGTSDSIMSNIVPTGDDPLSFKTDSLTSKIGENWLFTYNSNQSVNVSFIKVTLPIYAKMKSIDTSLEYQIEGSDALIITFIGNEVPVNISIKYSFTTASTASNSENRGLSTMQKYTLWLLGLALVIILLGAIQFILRKIKKRKASLELKENSDKINENQSRLKFNMEKLNAIKLTLNETQVKIIDALLSRDGVASQNTIHHQTSIPKASLSRNVDLLVQKQILIKHAGGYTNKLTFHSSILA